MPLPRRQFLTQASAGLAGTLLAGLVGSVPGCAPARSAVQGRLRGAGHALGHLLRTPDKIPAPTRTETIDTVIIGGGISGLAARRELHRLAPERSTILLELEADTGGNAATGHNARTAYPWGAHYLPIPDARDTELLAFLQQAGVLTGYGPTGLPIYDETMLCHDPAERLLLHGHWQAGLVPEAGVPAADRAEISRFLADMERLRRAMGPDGQDLFRLPLTLSSSDEVTRQLDTETMAAWLDRHGYQSEYLRWYLDYSYRDDFGVSALQISAWAGLHYFAARKGQAHNAPADAVLTWPQGNHFLAEALQAQGGPGRVQTQALVFGLHEANDSQLAVQVYDARTRQSTTLLARHVILATPWHVSKHLLPAPAAGPPLTPLHAPWLVANLTVAGYPGGPGQPLSWDNVRYGSPALGYIDAEHQALRGYEADEPRSLTFYWALPTDPADPAAARRHALASTYADWLALVLTELELMHPGLAAQVTAADLWVWGHGMVAPTPGYVWGPARALATQPRLGGRVHLAHTDLSGVSVFEEAFHQGQRAARAVLGASSADFQSAT
ncbi:NAD(P)/FAD-dependent oxidoreductase [Hymenobacter ginsengisoli]|uniref:NAD(P)/FAD-dependent oxidoreductase n=1 Tax=Hymenobacter ginsengisoli TaxID=1051626 RepID=A0ABP8Q081_9BACT|nr:MULTISPECIES: NAD(P)-binding protein [unclassified Hymenobacter]MBO2030507.1 FAD-dependent oxidoreductase [Hymenobacter sp. BT559]